MTYKLQSSFGYHRAFLWAQIPNQVVTLILMFVVGVQEKGEDPYDHVGKLEA